MKYVVLSTDGYGPKMYSSYVDAKEQALSYLYLCDERSHVVIISVGDTDVAKTSFYWEDYVEEATAAYKRLNP